jgi:hypothetical protein
VRRFSLKQYLRRTMLKGNSDWSLNPWKRSGWKFDLSIVSRCPPRIRLVIMPNPFHQTPLTALRRLPDRDEADLDPLTQHGGDSPQHRQRVAFVVGVFQTSGRRGAR